MPWIPFGAHATCTELIRAHCCIFNTGEIGGDAPPNYGVRHLAHMVASGWFFRT